MSYIIIFFLRVYLISPREPVRFLKIDQHTGGSFVLNSRKLSLFTPYKMAWVSFCCPTPSMGLPSTLNRGFLRQGLSPTSAACSTQSTQEASLTGCLGINPKSWWYYSAALQFSSTCPPSFIHSTSVSGKPAKSEPWAIDFNKSLWAQETHSLIGSE